MRRWFRLSAAIVVAMLVLGACGGADEGDDSASSDGSSEAAEPVQPGATGREEAAAPSATVGEAMQEADASGDSLTEDTDSSSDGTDADLGVPAALQPVDIGRSVVFTATIEVAVEDVSLAGEQALREVQGLGGLLFGQETTTRPEPRTVLTFKVLPADFQEALRRLAGLGDLRAQDVSSDDVTDRIVDLESRITTAAASVERLRALLDSAGNLDEIARLESQLLERETQLEQLRGQLRTLNDQVDLATIVLTLTAAEARPTHPAVQLAQAGYEGHDGGESCPGDRPIEADRNAAITVCFTVTNSGNAPLSSIEVSDDELGVTTADLAFVTGTLEQPLPAGERIVLAYETTVDGDLKTAGRVSAAPVDDDGEVRGGETVDAKSSIRVVALGAEPLPGFGDTLDASIGVLQSAVGLAIIVLAALIPFAWLILAVAVVAWIARRRRVPGPSA